MTTYSPILYGTKNNMEAGCGREGRGQVKGMCAYVCVCVGGWGVGGGWMKNKKKNQFYFDINLKQLDSSLA